jgi:hypothetical protein
MSDYCKKCRERASKETAKACRYLQCGLSLYLLGPDRFRRRYLAQMIANFPPYVLYHCFTGENDDVELARINKLDPSVLEPLLNKAEREWPDRLARIAAQNKREKQESERVVDQFIIDFHS